MLKLFNSVLNLVPFKTKPSPFLNLLSGISSNNFINDNNNSSSAADKGDLSADAERIYRILKKLHAHPPRLEAALRSSSIKLKPGLLEQVLSRCGNAGNLGFSFFSWARRRADYHPSADAYCYVLNMLAKMRQFGAAWAVVDEMRREFPEAISIDVFVTLIRRFASARLVSKAVQVLDEMPQYGYQPDAYVFGCLLDALAKNGHIKDAAKLFDEMREKFPPDVKQFTILLHGWCKAGKMVEAKYVLVRMREAGFEPDIVVYNTLLGGFSAAGKMEDCYELLKEMPRKGCEPNVASYTTLIQALCLKERMDEAMRVFVEMQRSGCIPDSITYITLISGFCKSGLLSRGYEVLDTMVKQGLRPNAKAYFYFFQVHEKKDELDKCLELMHRMEKSQCLLDVGIYSTVIRLACKLGDFKTAVDCWNKMENSALSPGLESFVIMVHGFLCQDHLIEACTYFKEMVNRGLFSAPQYGILKDLLNTLLRADKLELAKEMWACIVSKGCELNVFAWTIWIHALFSNKHVKEACSYCLDMMDSGLMPQPDTFAKLMKGLRKLYNRQIAAEITEKVRKMAEERNVTFKMYKRRGEFDMERKVKAKAKRQRRARRRTKDGKLRGRRDPINHLSSFSE